MLSPTCTCTYMYMHSYLPYAHTSHQVVFRLYDEDTVGTSEFLGTFTYNLCNATVTENPNLGVSLYHILEYAHVQTLHSCHACHTYIHTCARHTCVGKADPKWDEFLDNAIGNMPDPLWFKFFKEIPGK